MQMYMQYIDENRPADTIQIMHFNCVSLALYNIFDFHSQAWKYLCQRCAQLHNKQSGVARILYLTPISKYNLYKHI